MAGAVAAGAGIVLGHFQGAGREKLPNGEGHVAEQAAGVLLVAAAALRLGDAVVIHRDQQLGVPLQPHQGKLAQGHIEPAASAVVEHQLLAEAAGDERRNFRQAALTAPGLAAVVHPGVQNDGVHGLHHGGGQVGTHAAGDIQLVNDRVGGKDLGAALAAEQDAALVEHAQALGPDATGRSGTHLQGHAVEKPHVNGVESPVEGHRLHIGVNVQQLRRAAPNHLASGQQLHGRCRGIEPQVLHAVLVAAGIEDLPCMDTNGLANTAQIADRARHSVFRHEINLPLSNEGAGCALHSSVCRLPPVVREKGLYKSGNFRYNKEKRLERMGYAWLPDSFTISWRSNF